MIVTTLPKDENTNYMDKLISPSYYVMPPYALGVSYDLV